MGKGATGYSGPFRKLLGGHPLPKNFGIDRVSIPAINWRELGLGHEKPLGWENGLRQQAVFLERYVWQIGPTIGPTREGLREDSLFVKEYFLLMRILWLDLKVNRKLR
ncbi:conserved hypothetical protein [Roseibium sp. TrichSKD4]|nr:conserved hypothetical protein [Roseibium sp. TrichSKD4]